jgi:hypothetical protein
LPSTLSRKSAKLEFYELFTPDTPQIWVTAFEAVAGLLIEGVFIAMLTQRFFGK